MLPHSQQQQRQQQTTYQLKHSSLRHNQNACRVYTSRQLRNPLRLSIAAGGALPGQDSPITISSAEVGEDWVKGVQSTDLLQKGKQQWMRQRQLQQPALRQHGWKTM
jgi:hypothetical protein